ncbi:ABC transporter substrate-binding protein [Megamonas hypermegale]|uniref:ABC transporter substrate-binding protein n=1 Tax=Megamonas hypermegale TaxID=158847 RepID=UPI0025A49801|nr:ABC transporter substrate-binding protein [Megamonas hypermegale]MDM8142761.1 ABC transporter substrate-binding protein [Megamonas hypermegale]
MNFGKKRLRMAGMLLGITMLGSVFAGCGGEEAANSNEIKVGANFEITGNVANYGTTARDGFKLAIKEANEAGGIDGKQIVIVEADNKSDPAESANAATKLISDDKVVAIVGPATSGAVQAESQIATENKIPIIAPCATSPDITVENGQVKEFVFRGCFIDPLQSNTMANFAANELKAKTAVIYLDSSTDYSKSLAEVFKNKFEALGGKVVMQEAFVAKDQDFKAALTNIKTANADVIYIPAYYEEVGKIVKQARELGITQPILGTDGWDDTKVVDIAGADALNNTYYVTHYIDTDPDVKAFVDSFTKEYGHAPGVFAALGYDAGKMLVDAIKRAGSTDPVAIQKALAETKDLQVGTGKLTVDANHNLIKNAFIIEMKDGVKTLKERVTPTTAEG